jgi:DnaK suppressor protein
MPTQLKKHNTVSRDTLREMLLNLYEEARAEIKTLRKDQEQESEPGPADEMDSARTTAEVETHAGLIARAQEKLRYADEALVRLDSGKYGLCMECGEAIPVERLEAVPFASYCVDCQGKRNRARHDWGEGTTIAPYDHQWTRPEEMQEPADRDYRSPAPEEQLSIDTRGTVESGKTANLTAHRRSKRQNPQSRN